MSLVKHALSDYLYIEIVGIILASLMTAAVTTYVSYDAVYKASIVGGPITPILGTRGYIDSYVREMPAQYYAGYYVKIKERITKLFLVLMWSHSMLLSSVYTIASTISVFPSLYRLRVSMIPLMFREGTSLHSLNFQIFLVSMILLAPLFVSIAVPLIILARGWLAEIPWDLLVLLLVLLAVIIFTATAIIHSVYILSGRLDFALVLALLVIVTLSQRLNCNMNAVKIYAGISVAFLLFMHIAFQKRWMDL